mgnify:CR=1 FL=1
MKIEHDDIFYLGDQPVTLQDTENPSKGQSLGFDIQGVEAYLPITPKLALYMPCLSTTEAIMYGYKTSLELAPLIKKAEISGQPLPGITNEHIAAMKRTLITGRPFFEAVSMSVPLICIPEYVENFNYLQCMWAHENIYSNLRDFTFAKKVLTKSPQYRETPRTSVEELF